MGGIVTFDRPDGKECTGYYTEPKNGDRAPAVIVIQEWWGLNDQIKGVADHMATAGYRAMAPDLYQGKVTLDAAEAAHLMSSLDFQEAVSQNIRGAVMFMKQNNPKVAVVGFCMGGALSILAAIHIPEVTAVSCWYGVPPPEAGDPGTIRAPLQGHFALKDDYFTPAIVDALEAKLRESGVKYEFYRYQAEHGFGNDTGTHYNAEAARLAWQRTFSFLSKHSR